MEKNKEIIKEAIHIALKTWSKSSSISDSQFSNLPSLLKHESIDEYLTYYINKLAVKNKLEAKVLLFRFKNKRSIRSVAHELNFSVDQINRLQRNGIGELAEIVIHQEKKIREERSDYFISQIPEKSSITMFGFEKSTNIITENLLSIKGSSVVTITGLGGIGKTALAEEVSKNLFKNSYFSKIIWYRSDDNHSNKNEFDTILDYLGKQMVPSDAHYSEKTILIQKIFKTSPHLVIIDNLNLSASLEEIIEGIKNICGISKFLLTSRQQASPFNSEVFNYRLEEMSIEDAGKLLSFQSKFIGLSAYSSDINDNLEDIYTIIGGNPLALKLFVGLLDSLPLMTVLNDFKVANINDIKSLYKHIYHLAWNSLDDNSKKVLVGMIQSTSVGFTIENIAGYSNIVQNDLANSIKTLFEKSLLEKRGSLENCRFGIHRLTHSFLETDIVKWPPK